MTPPNADPALDLLLLAGQSRSRDELLFIMANRSVTVCPYDRASLWSLDRGRRLVAISGTESVNSDSPFARSWSRLLRKMKNAGRAALLDADSFSDADGLEGVAEMTDGLSALWTPLPGLGVGALFERWGGEEFSADDAARLERLAAAYDLIRVRRRPRRRGAARLAWLTVPLALAAVLALVRVPLRVVAPCEVTARDPFLVSAPMDGVIEDVAVAPGQRVEAGDTLALYDSRLMNEELNITRRQVAVVEAELAEARARGFAETRFRGHTAILEARLEQELARLDALEVKFSLRRVTAGVAGVVQLDNARAWRGRPVATGQAVMWLVNPSDTRVSLWLPQDDRIDIDMSRPVRVYLHALDAVPRTARLSYVSSFSTASPAGGYAFSAEAEWLDRSAPTPLGLTGTAAIYGDEVSLGYWLLRRPLARVRFWLGI